MRMSHALLILAAAGALGGCGKGAKVAQNTVKEPNLVTAADKVTPGDPATDIRAANREPEVPGYIP